MWEKGGRGLPKKLCRMSPNEWTRIAPSFPALVGSEIVMRDKARNIEILMEGVQGAAMQSFANQLSEVDMASVITYTRESWGNGKRRW
ncbi:MAG: hypothetical protein Ct9H300mP3_06170 [Gammaproteobacteria bacterium]|nr:MAG: hypothetical protein Ct9H300mP3_06170 [Gammaproteobacteria bacterium]